ncbi:DUF6660 family protein [Flavobacterium sp. BFFFF1]|uniref:DUF6660 family protein n=1 Tax=Flavobacterium sp. BFFFF1 TaxID=2015557 RepID=UPI0025C596D4|nr:DUF6660 family protein [Flavobacterium sp. BFFFF1]
MESSGGTILSVFIASYSINFYIKFPQSRHCIKTFVIFTTVKTLSLILSCLFAVLSCIPCADGGDDAGCSDSKATTEKGSADNDHKGSDLCSPFCICSCCAAHAINFSTALTFEPVMISELISRQEIIYKSPLASSFTGSIWQPPQLV